MTIRRNYLGILSLLLSGSIFLATSCDNGSRVSDINNTSDTNEEITEVTIPNEPNGADVPRLAVAPPINGLDVPFKEYKVDVAQGATLETETGSTISIPANAFIDKDGNPIEGEVAIKFREFHDAKDIIASGIPMHNPETGEYMETAGMFEIKGEHNGNEIFVKADKDINVSLASYNEGDQFNFYELGPKDCRWKDKGTAKAEPNTKKIQKLNRLKKKMAKVDGGPRKANEVENYVFDMDVNYKRFPELKPFKNVVWEYTGDGLDPEQNEWVFGTNWDEVSLTEAANGYYSLKLKNNSKTFVTTVRPVLAGKDYEKALALFNKSKGAEAEKIKQEVIAERNRIEQQASLVRAFRVSNFGIYNWDIWKNPNRIRCNPEVLVENERINGRYFGNISFFLVSDNARSVVRYETSTLNKFSFDPLQRNALLAVTDGGQIAVFSADEFKALDLNTIRDSKALFNMAKTTSKIKDLTELDDIIAKAIG